MDYGYLLQKYGIYVTIILLLFMVFSNPLISGINTDQRYISHCPQIENQTSTTEYYDYVIITSEDLAQSTNFFRNWKTIIGFSVKLINISHIEREYTGIDTAESIRNFLKDKIDVWGIEYVLILGDGDIVPWRYCFQPSNDDFSIPTDYYYADLTSDWDSDGDGLFGEVNEDEWPGFKPDVSVGRIPVNDPDNLEHILQKIIRFEQDSGNWKKNVLLLGAITNFENEIGQGNPKTDSAALMELIKQDLLDGTDFSTTTMYEKEGLESSIYESDMALTEENVINEWNKGYGIVSWGSHGSAKDSYRKWWIADPNGNNVPDINEFGEESFISRFSAYSLNDEYPSFVISDSCYNANPEFDENLGKTLLKNGAISVIAATHYSYYVYGWNEVSDGGCMTITYHIFNNFINSEQSFGDAFYNAMYYCWSEEDINILDANMYVFTLYGDPSLSFQTYSGLSIPSNPLKPSGPQELKPDMTYKFTTIADNDSGNNDIYYIWDWGDGNISLPLGPYKTGEEVSISHKWETPGKYRLKVKTINLIGQESTWSEPLLLHITGPVIKIGEISGGLLKVNTVIKNIGDEKAENIDWKIVLQGGMIFLGQRTQGTIISLEPNEKLTIISKAVYGFGFPSVVTVEAGISDGTSDIEVQSANIIFSVIRID